MKTETFIIDSVDTMIIMQEHNNSNKQEPCDKQPLSTCLFLFLMNEKENRKGNHAKLIENHFLLYLRLHSL